MSQKIFRFVLLGLAAGLMLGAITGCFFGGGEEEEPTPDLQATIDAAVREATPTETPTPEPTDPPVPPTPDVAATVAAMLAASRPTPVPLTNTPLPTNTPRPTAESPQSGPPCIVAGRVIRNGQIPPPGTIVTARTQNNIVVEQAEVSETGIYQLTITRFGESFSLWVDNIDTGVDTGVCARGDRQAKSLSVN